MFANLAIFEVVSQTTRRVVFVAQVVEIIVVEQCLMASSTRAWLVSSFLFFAQ